MIHRIESLRWLSVIWSPQGQRNLSSTLWKFCFPRANNKWYKNICIALYSCYWDMCEFDEITLCLYYWWIPIRNCRASIRSNKIFFRLVWITIKKKNYDTLKFINFVTTIYYCRYIIVIIIGVCSCTSKVWTSALRRAHFGTIARIPEWILKIFQRRRDPLGHENRGVRDFQIWMWQKAPFEKN